MSRPAVFAAGLAVGALVSVTTQIATRLIAGRSLFHPDN